jgi:hypothetical protein
LLYGMMRSSRRYVRVRVRLLELNMNFNTFKSVTVEYY